MFVKNAKIAAAAAAAAVAFAFASSAASATTLINGDFEAESLTGWTVTTTATGTTRAQNTASFNTTGSGASIAAHFNVGRTTKTAGSTQGINLSQSFTAIAGQYTISVNVAASRSNGGGSTPMQGGIFRLFAGAVLLDDVDFLSLNWNETKRDTLSGVVTLAAGLTALRIEIVRDDMTSGNSPQQYVDNVVLIPPVLTPVPVPAGLPLMILGLGALGIAQRWQE